MYSILSWVPEIGAYEMKSIVRIPETVRLLEPKQIFTLSPADKDRYYDKVIVDILQANPSGVTISEIEDATNFLAKTLRAHVKRLVAWGEAVSFAKGKMVLYYPNGQIMGKPTIIEARSRLGTVYAVNKIRDAFNNLSYYIQEKELDEYRTLRVKGGISISLDDMRKFVTELHTVSLRDSQNKEGAEQ